MLIDIEKYVVQQLAPNKRLPVNIGLGSTLLAPFNFIINASNEFYNNSEFDLGTPGQVGVLEYILQTFVDSNIRIEDGTGSVIDFRVLVPAALSLASRGDVVKYVDKYKLTSKRYEIVDQLSWDGGSIPTTPLAFAYGPVASESSAGNYLISYALNTSGNFATLIKNGASVYFNEVKEYVAGQTVNFPVTNVGGWSVSVGNIIGEMEIAPSTITGKPSWIVKISYTHDVNTNEFTLYVNATEDVEIRMTAKVAPQPSGITTGDLPWTSTTYLAGTKEYTEGSGYTQFFRFNPTSQGVDGILRAKDYTLHIRRKASPTTVYEYDFTTKSVSNLYPPADFTLADATLPSCSLNGGRPPTIPNPILYSNANATGFQFDAEGVPRFYGRITNGGTIYRKTLFVYFEVATDVEKALANAAVPTPEVQLFTSNVVTFNYGTLDAGSYTLEIEGASCSSAVAVKPITIVGTELAFVSGYPNYSNVSANNNTIRIKINKSGAYPTRVYNNTTNVELLNQSKDYSGDAIIVITGATVGAYTITVGSLTAGLNITDPVATGDFVAKTLFECMTQHMNIVVSGSSENWLISDLSDYGLGAEWEYLYRVGGQIIRGKNKLTNLPWQTNMPFRVSKGIIKIGVSNNVWWPDPDTEGNYQTMSYNQSSANWAYSFKPV